MKPLLGIRTASKMMYRNHQEYRQPDNKEDYELLRRWLRGETGVESLRTWLHNMYG